MKISLAWLNDYVECADLSDTAFEDVITTRVAEVDAVEQVGAPLANAVVAEITSFQPHPERDNLTLLTLAIGKQTVEVVCGAQNCRVDGAKVAYIPPGKSFFPGGQEAAAVVEAREVHGVASTGVVVSEAELQLSGDHQGILLLDDTAKPGTSLTKLCGEPDVVIEIDNKSLTHRPDLWSHAGFAREIAAILGRPLRRAIDELADDDKAGAKRLQSLGSGKPAFSVAIADGSGCRRFCVLEISGVSAVQSPLWMRRRLFSVGGGVRNLLVDASNYVMFDIGQPNHAYDADLLEGTTVHVRRATKNEKFIGLDDVERKLSTDDIVIADDKRAVALGGVIGGQATAVHDGTTRLLLESANFDPVAVRKTSKRHAVRTDASNRFEKSQSAFGVPLAIHRFLEVVQQVLPDAAAVGAVADSFVERPAAVSVPLSYEFVRRRLGAPIEDKKIADIISSLGFAITGKGKTTSVDVPYFRATRDIAIPEDLVEEVGRIYGYENIPEQEPLIASVASGRDALRQLEEDARDFLCGAGFSEISGYSFVGAERAEQLGYPLAQTVQMQNPVAADLDRLRTSLVPGVLQRIEDNSRFQSTFSLFELGRSYIKRKKKGETPCEERRLLCAALVGPRDEKQLSGSLAPALSSGASFYGLRTAVSDLVTSLTGESAEFAVIGSPLAWMHPFRAADVQVGGAAVGCLAEVRPAMLEDVAGRAVVIEIDLEALLAQRKPVTLFEPISKYPDSFFEMSVVMPQREPFANLRQLVEQHIDPEVYRGIEVVSYYEGKPLAADEKSISVKMFLGAADRTLDSDELKAVQDRLVQAVDSSSYALRS